MSENYDRKGSIIKDVLIIHRPGDPSIFCCNNSEGMFSVYMAGYAIVPLEDFLDKKVVKKLKRHAVRYVERDGK